MTDRLTAEVASYLDGLLADGLDPTDIARRLLADAATDDRGRVRIEVPSHWTRDGKPLPATF